MLTIEECRKILGTESEKLTDEEINQIINWLSMMAEIILDSIEKNEDFTSSQNNK